MPLRRATPALLALVLAGGVLAPAGASQAAPDQKLPFTCGEQWTGTTRTGHSPSALAIDFNRANDLGRLVMASAPGLVSRVADTGAKGYGKWIRVDHGDGRSTVYAHLQAQWPVVGQYVDQGAPIGRVGSSGGVSGAHLHYEQRVGNTVVRPYFHQQPFVFGSTMASGNCPDVPLAGDWDGDGTDEVAVFRRSAGAGTFVRSSTGAPLPVVRLGRGFDLPVVGDWDGDGVTDVGVRRQGPRRFVLRTATGTVVPPRVGKVGDLPVAGDWNADGVTDLGLWRPGATAFRLVQPDGTHTVVRLGARGSQPLTGDWDGDGVTDLGVYDAATSVFTQRFAAPGTAPTLVSTALGLPGDLPVTGDWDGDGVTDLGVWAPSTATFTLRVAPVRAAARNASQPELRTLVFGRPR